MLDLLWYGHYSTVYLQKFWMCSWFPLFFAACPNSDASLANKSLNLADFNRLETKVTFPNRDFIDDFRPKLGTNLDI
jgi:hypothetical protein